MIRCRIFHKYFGELDIISFGFLTVQWQNMITLHKIIIHEPDGEVLSVEAESSDLVTIIIQIQGPASIGQCWPLTKAALPVTHRPSLRVVPASHWPEDGGSRPLIGGQFSRDILKKERRLVN